MVTYWVGTDAEESIYEVLIIPNFTKLNYYYFLINID
jgi:hypothetical protein